MTQLPGLPDAALMFTSINDLGDIVGSSIPGSSSYFELGPFKSSGTPPAFTMLATPIGCSARPSKINNRGLIAGAAWPPSDWARHLVLRNRRSPLLSKVR
jgi:hypothetical protein